MTVNAERVIEDETACMKECVCADAVCVLLHVDPEEVRIQPRLKRVVAFGGNWKRI